jgi:cytochrome c biogenesis protein CcmG/thiol:disulfide interchange protein DsbE
MKKSFLPAFIILIIISLTVFTGCQLSSGGSTVGGDFTLNDLSGKEVSLSDYTGKIVILNFWATWCSPCRQEIPDFVDVFDDYKNEDIQFLGISNEDVYTLRNFVLKYDINYPILVDDAGVMNNWGIKGIPTTFIIDREGKIIYKNVGAMTKAQLVNIIEDVL